MSPRRLKRFKAFSLIEVLVAMSIIALASTSIITVLSHAAKYMRVDAKLQLATQICDAYLTDIYMATNIRQKLFSPQDLSNLAYNAPLPRLLAPQRITTPEGLLLLVNKKVRKLDPLLVDIGLEVIWKPTDSSNARSRQYWVETSISERYLMSLK